MTQADEISAYWAEAAARLGLDPSPEITGHSTASLQAPPAFSFGDTPELADDLLDLVLSGTKTATASSYWEYEADAEPLPQVGDLSIALDGAGHPRAVLRVEEVQIVPFDEVGSAHAAAEGEGDGSLEYWRQTHRTFFARTSSTGQGFDDRMAVVCERFSVIHPR